MKTYNEIKEILEGMNLNNKSVTGGRNGYPEPYLGEFYYGFDTFEEIKEFVKENGGVIASASWKDGWAYCNDISETYKPFEISPNSFSDNYHFIYLKYEKEDFADYLGYSSIKEMKNYESKEEILEHLERFRVLLDECEGVDFDKQYLVEYCGEYEIIDKEALEFSYDTINEAIGVWLDPDDFDNNEEENNDKENNFEDIKTIEGNLAWQKSQL